MAKIRIGDAEYTASVGHSGKTLALTFEKARIEEIAALLSEEHAPQVMVLNADNRTVKAIYRNHALTSVKTEVVGGVCRVYAVLTTDEIAKSQADGIKEEIDALKAENEILTACLLEMSEIVYA